MKHDSFLRTPQKGIVLGEWIKTESGELALRVKKSGSSEYEIIPAIKVQIMILQKQEELSR